MGEPFRQKCPARLRPLHDSRRPDGVDRRRVAALQGFRELILIDTSTYYSRTPDYPGGLTQRDLDQPFTAMATNYPAWAKVWASARSLRSS